MKKEVNFMKAHKILGVVAAMICFGALCLQPAEAGIRDKFQRWSSFSGFSEVKNSFQRLADISGKWSSLNHSFQKLANVSMNGELRSSFTRMTNLNINAGLRPSFERMGNLNINTGLKPSFERMADLNMDVQLRPAFSRMANINMSTGLKPSFAKLANINIKTNLSPSFSRMANVSFGTKLSTSLKKLADVSGISGSIKPVFAKLATVRTSMSKALQPGFMRLADVEFSVKLNPSFARLASLDPRLLRTSSRIEQKSLPELRAQPTVKQIVYGRTVPRRIKTIKIAPRKEIALTYLAPIDTYRLALQPASLLNISVQETAGLLHQDLASLQLKAGEPIAAKAAQPMSLRSLLAVETAH
jgi:hypothetical protein